MRRGDVVATTSHYRYHYMDGIRGAVHLFELWSANLCSARNIMCTRRELAKDLKCSMRSCVSICGEVEGKLNWHFEAITNRVLHA